MLAAAAYLFVTTQVSQVPFRYASKPSKDARLPFFSQHIDAGFKRVHISVSIYNPTAANFALCVLQPGQKLPVYRRNLACGGQLASQMQTGDSDAAHPSLILEDRSVTLEWFSNFSHAPPGNFSVVFENHNLVSAASFEAAVHANTFYVVGSDIDGFFSHLLILVRSSFSALSNAYSLVRPASCRAAAKSSFNVALLAKCRSFLAEIDNTGSTMLLCDALAGGHSALVLIVLLNALCYLPSIADQSWWALHANRPSWRTLFTYQFAHANLQHIAGNMLTLLFVGTEVSESLNCDHILFVLFYLLCGLAGGLFASWLSPAHVQTVGASGSVSGVIVALSVLRPNSAVTLLGDVNASNPLLLLAGTLLADLQRLGVSWQVLPFFPSPCLTLVCIRSPHACVHVFLSRIFWSARQGHLGGGIAGYALASLRVTLLRALAA